MKTVLIFSLCCLMGIYTHAQTTTTVAWDTLIGGTAIDGLVSIEESPVDTTIVIVGYTGSASFSGYQGGFDILVTKTNRSGTIIFQNVYGTPHTEFSYKAKILPNGDIICVGSMSPEFGVPLNPLFLGSNDILVMKISREGILLWQKYYGGSQNDVARDVLVNTNGDLVVIGHTNSPDGDFASCVFHGSLDAFVLVLDSVNGNVVSSHLFGGTNQDRLLSCLEATNGMYYFSGWTLSNDGDVSGNHGTTTDGWVLCVDQNFSFIWQKCIGTTQNEHFYSIVEGNNGNLFLSGVAEPTPAINGDISSYKGGNDDGLIVSITPTGTLLWVQTYGGTASDYELFLKKNHTGTLYAYGITESNDLQVLGNYGVSDTWVFSFDENGSMLSTTMIGKPGYDQIVDLVFLDTTNFVGIGEYATASFSAPWDGYVISTISDFRIKLPPPVITMNSYNQEEESYPLVCGVPSIGDMFVIFPKPFLGSDIEIYTISGSLVLSETCVFESVHRIDITNLPSGIYVISITKPNKLFRQKIQKL